MANKLIKHAWSSDGFDSVSTSESLAQPSTAEADKSKSISNLSLPELYKMMERLRTERDLEEVIKSLKRNSGERDTYEKPFEIDTTTPINQLYHHGILGQKWGIRRFQNKDGTRTPAGRKRDEGSSKSDDHTTSRKAQAKAPSGLSNEELRKLNDRLQLEETYKRLTKDDLQKSESWVKKAIKSGGEQALSEFSKGIFLGSAKLFVKEISPEFAATAFNVKEKKKE